MKNPNSKWARLKAFLKARWSGEDFPSGTKRFQVKFFGKDVAVFVLLPIASILAFKSCENSLSTKEKSKSPPNAQRGAIQADIPRSEIIESKILGSGSGLAGIAKRAPGSLVRVKLLNLVETYSNAPVHVRIINDGLGAALLGGTLVGDGTPDTNFERINITFRFALDPMRPSMAIPISARALSLDGTFGVIATKKEGFLGRSVIGSAGAASAGAQGKNESTDFKDILVKALTAGLIQEFNSSSQVEKNRSQVLTIQPSTEFFVELTDFFPGSAK